MRNNNEIEEVKNLCKACLPILVEYIEAIDVDFYNIVLYQQTDKYRSYDELFEIIRIFCRDNQELYLKIRDFESVQFCISFLDLTTIYEYFINFQQSLYDLFEEHKKLCVHLYEAFHLNGKTPEILVCANIYKHKDYVSEKIDAEFKDEFKQLLYKIDSCKTSFLINFFSYRGAHYNDIILNEYMTLKDLKPNFIKITIDNTKKSIYVYQNVLSEYISGKDIKLCNDIDKLKESGSSIFVFSPYIIEDGIKMDIMRFNVYLEKILSLTDGVLMGRIDDELAFINEDINSLVGRVLRWLPATVAAEEYKYITAKINELSNSYFDKNSKLVKRISNNIGFFFSDKHVIENIILDSERELSLYEFLKWTIISKGLSFSIDDLINRKITWTNDEDLINKIEGLCTFLDLINYKTESTKDKMKVKSSYQDIQHLTHAWKCNYLLTNDKRLISRGEFIYYILRIETKILRANEINTLIH